MHAQKHGVSRISAEVHAENAPSVRLFEGADFSFRRRDGTFITYERSL
jgi:RimJ/RimL family protein N-acetyltransferase